MTYAEKLRDPRWQQKRLRMLDAAGWVCLSCGASDSTLHVHHRRYIKGRDPWDYDDSELRVLCAKCHELEHDARSELDTVLLVCEGQEFYDIAALAAGYLETLKFRYMGEDYHRLCSAYLAGALAAGPGSYETLRRFFLALQEALDNGIRIDRVLDAMEAAAKGENANA